MKKKLNCLTYICSGLGMELYSNFYSVKCLFYENILVTLWFIAFFSISSHRHYSLYKKYTMHQSVGTGAPSDAEFNLTKYKYLNRIATMRKASEI